MNVFLQKTNISWDWGFESCRGHGKNIQLSNISGNKITSNFPLFFTKKYLKSDIFTVESIDNELSDEIKTIYINFIKNKEHFSCITLNKKILQEFIEQANTFFKNTYIKTYRIYICFSNKKSLDIQNEIIRYNLTGKALVKNNSNEIIIAEFNPNTPIKVYTKQR